MCEEIFFCFVSVLNVSALGCFCDVLAKNILPVLEIVVYLHRDLLIEST